MNKAIQLIVIFVLSLISISANTQRVFKAADGFRAPLFTVSNSENTVSLNDLKGEYVLVNFWSSTDAASRIAAADYDRYFKNGVKNVRLISINLDTDAALFNAVVAADSLDRFKQYRADGDSAGSLMTSYAINDVMTSFLVDPSGSIIATNPSPELLNRI